MMSPRLSVIVKSGKPRWTANVRPWFNTLGDVITLTGYSEIEQAQVDSYRQILVQHFRWRHYTYRL